LKVTEAGLLTARVAADNSGLLVPRLSLDGAAKQVLIQSDGLKGTSSTAQIVQHLQPGTYFLAVAAAAETGPYVLTMGFETTTSPLDRLATGSMAPSVVVADVNGDGRSDLIATHAFDDTLSVLLGNGDGTFQKQQTFVTGSDPYSVAVTDVNGDGR